LFEFSFLSEAVLVGVDGTNIDVGYLEGQQWLDIFTLMDSKASKRGLMSILRKYSNRAKELGELKS
jgi:hypothetical protein